jgi:hypothetical protein
MALKICLLLGLFHVFISPSLVLGFRLAKSISKLIDCKSRFVRLSWNSKTWFKLRDRTARLKGIQTSHFYKESRVQGILVRLHSCSVDVRISFARNSKSRVPEPTSRIGIHTRFK